jgi:hypothetical protein
MNLPNEQKPHATFDWLWILWAFLWTPAAITWGINFPDTFSFQSFCLGFVALAALKYLIRYEP